MVWWPGLVEDAGGHYLLDHRNRSSLWGCAGGSNIEMELEQFALLAADADAWGKVVYAPEGGTGRMLRRQCLGYRWRTSCFSIATQQKSDYFGQAVLEPDLMLSDLVSLFTTSPSC